MIEDAKVSLLKGTKHRAVIGPLRCNYPCLAQKSSFEGKEGKHEIQLLIPKTPKGRKLKEALEKLMEAAPPGKKHNWEKKVWEAAVKRMRAEKIQDGDKKRDANEKQVPEYKGHFWVKATNSRKPDVKDITGQNDLDPQEIYSGCWVNVIAESFRYHHPSSKPGIGLSLLAVQFASDDEPFASKVDASSVFENYSQEEQEGDYN